VLVDSHCHLDRLCLSESEDLAAVLHKARQRGVGAFLCIGIGRSNAPQVIAIAESYPEVYATVGVHPLEFSPPQGEEQPAEQGGQGEVLRQWLLEQARHPKVVGIGETGLDYYYSAQDKEAQQESFIVHLEVAARLRKPVVVHCRDAGEDALNLIRQYGSAEHAGVFHCFTESWEGARQALDLGFYISFSGIVTFKNADKLREIVPKIPENRLLVETDSPYLSPVPWRGKPNQPGNVVEVAQCLADLRGISCQQLAELTSMNFARLFAVNPLPAPQSMA